MYDKAQLAKTLGYSENQLVVRLREFRPILDQYIKRGRKNKILVTDDGLEILRRAKELEKNDVTLSEIGSKLKHELNHGNTQTDRDKERSTFSTELVQTLTKAYENQIGVLEEQLKDKEREIERLHQILQNRLPPTSNDRYRKKDEALGVWGRFIQLLKGK